MNDFGTPYYLTPEQAAQARQYIRSYAFTRPESAVVIAATIILVTLTSLDLAWFPGGWWLWLLLGLVAEMLVGLSTWRDDKLYRQTLERMFPQVFGLSNLRSPELQQKVAKILEYRTLIVKEIEHQRGSGLDDHFGRMARDLDDWITQVYHLAQGLDRYWHDPIIARDLETVPRELAKFQSLLTTDQGDGPLAELEKAIALKQTHWDTLKKLQDTMAKAQLRLENTLSAIGVIYTQVRLLESKDASSNRRAQQLLADMTEQAHALADISAAMDEIYKTRDG